MIKKVLLYLMAVILIMLPFKNRPLLVVDFFVGIAMIEMSCYSGE